jgi:hypothetical protein
VRKSEEEKEISETRGLQEADRHKKVVESLKAVRMIAKEMTEGKTEPLEKLFEWRAYDRRLKNALQVANVTNDDDRYMMLENTGGREVVNALVSIEKEGTISIDEKFKSAISGLYQFFGRGVTQMSCRIQLRKMRQKAEESFTSFIARIKSIAHMMQDVFDIIIAEIEILMILQDGARLGEKVRDLMTVQQLDLAKIEGIIPIIESQEKETKSELKPIAPAVVEEVVNKISTNQDSQSSGEWNRSGQREHNYFPKYQGNSNFNGNRGNSRGYFRGNYRGNYRGNFRGNGNYSNTRNFGNSSQNFPRDSYKRPAPESDDSNMMCYSCHEIGHRAANCGKLRKPDDKIYEIKKDVSYE